MYALFPLIKFSKKEYIEALYYRGEMFCQSLQAFARIEDNIGRGDPLETVTGFDFHPNCKIEFKAVDAPDSEFELLCVSDVQTRYSASVYRNLYCMFGMIVTQDQYHTEFTIDSRLKEFGDYFLIIKDKEQFIERVGKALHKLGKKAQVGSVMYKDFSGYKGPKSYTEKSIEFSYQKEFRIAIEATHDEPLLLTIGSLEDIAEMNCCNNITALSFYSVDSDTMKTSD